MDPQLITYADFFAGQANNLNPNLMPKNSVDLGLNVDFDEELGSAVSRLGSAQIDSQLVDNKPILGLFQHVDQADTTKNKLFAVVNDSSNTNADIWDLDGSPAISLADDTASLKTRFLNYAGDTLRLNGTDAPKAYNSASWITTGGVFDLANMPTGYKYAAEFLDRVYLWGKTASPYTLAYSGVLTTGTVSWTSGNGTVEIEPDDNGGEGTGLGKVPGYLLIFKRRSMHRWNYSSAFPEELVKIGAYSQESIIEGGGLCAFYSDSNDDAKGFYITNGGRPQAISHDSSRPIKKWVDAINSSATVAGWATDRVFAWSVGDLTVDGITYTNVVLRYNRILNQWSVRSYPNEFKVFAHYVASGVHSTVGGDDDGNVWQIDKAATFRDGTTDITWKIRTQPDYFGTNKLKTAKDRVVVRGKNIDGYSASLILDESFDTTVFATMNRLWRKLIGLFDLNGSVEATSIAVEVTGQQSGARAYIRQIELTAVTASENYDS